MRLITPLSIKENMNKLFNKLRRRDNLPPSSRITSETIVQHREYILSGGRKFKYPLQYARHKLVINTIIISIVALLIVVLVGWWQLYPAQNTSEFMYRITKVIPVPVAVVDGQSVLYSDYLVKYLSSVHYLEQKEQLSLKTDDGKKQVEYIKQQSMQDAIADAYAAKLAKNLGILVSGSELEGFLIEQRQSSDGEISTQTYNSVIMDYYGWSPAEYRQVTQNKLLRQKVSYAVDDKALNAINSAINIVKVDPETSLKTLADTISAQKSVNVVYNTSDWVPKNNQDGGLSTEAAKLNKLQASGTIKSSTGDGYYIIRLLDSNSLQVNYEYIRVPLTAFAEALNEVTSSGKVKVYISV